MAEIACQISLRDTTLEGTSESRTAYVTLQTKARDQNDAPGIDVNTVEVTYQT